MWETVAAPGTRGLPSQSVKERHYGLDIRTARWALWRHHRRTSLGRPDLAVHSYPGEPYHAVRSPYRRMYGVPHWDARHQRPDVRCARAPLRVPVGAALHYPL